jgi:hypothetical protein
MILPLPFYRRVGSLAVSSVIRYAKVALKFVESSANFSVTIESGVTLV